ncbi:MAG: SulP family inorganic anion transporter [Bacteroidia bacterium]|nr:SulP family inorganic anion transporter [Bacteroidia bacterium]
MLKNFKQDFSASIVVFLVALPLCLGIALASGAPLFSGIISGAVGGIIIGFLSKSHVSVSGPAAGLTGIVIVALGKLPSYNAFLLAVIIAGVLQYIMGLIKAGVINQYFPNSVIKGMLASIGIILILKQFPHAVGYDGDFEGDESFIQKDGHNTFSELYYSLSALTLSAVAISIISIGILVFWSTKAIKKVKYISSVPAPLLVVLIGVVINILFIHYDSNDSLRKAQLVNLPVPHTFNEYKSLFLFPDFNQLSNLTVYIIALQIAIVASIETLLSIEAADKIDPEKRITPANHELKAQGTGNFIAGFLGGLPITSVIVRTSANVDSGSKTKLSAILHGVILLISALTIPLWLNYIPKASLAAILIVTGYKLTRIGLFKEMKAKGLSQLIPFVVTIVAVLLTDLLIGIFIGTLTGLYFTMRSNFHSALRVTQDGKNYLIKFKKETSFLNKPQVKDALQVIPDGSSVLIDITKADYIDLDIVELINDFIETSKRRSLTITVKRNYRNVNVPLIEF